MHISLFILKPKQHAHRPNIKSFLPIPQLMHISKRNNLLLTKPPTNSPRRRRRNTLILLLVHPLILLSEMPLNRQRHHRTQQTRPAHDPPARVVPRLL